MIVELSLIIGPPLGLLIAAGTAWRMFVSPVLRFKENILLRLDRIENKQEQFNKDLTEIKTAFNDRITHVENRVTKLEDRNWR